MDRHEAAGRAMDMSWGMNDRARELRELEKNGLHETPEHRRLVELVKDYQSEIRDLHRMSQRTV